MIFIKHFTFTGAYFKAAKENLFIDVDSSFITALAA